MVPWLDPDLIAFPPTSQALGPDTGAPGLLAAGGDLSVARLQAAYAQGIFPWFSLDEPILWWTLAPRMVLPVAEFKFSRSLRKTLHQWQRAHTPVIRLNHATGAVIDACAAAPRGQHSGTWIVPAMREAYQHMADAGLVHSVEAWRDGALVGGLYGVKLGRMFYGESMFTRERDASKLALAALVALCRAHGIPWIDCQQQTAHLASMGARPVSRTRFEAHLAEHVRAPTPEWAWDESLWHELAPQAAPA